MRTTRLGKLEYASNVWSLHFIKYINSIENVRRHFTKRIRFISDLPYLERRLAVMDLEPLELRRIMSDLTMYFKIYNNLSALPSNYLPGDNSIRISYSRKKCGYLIQPFCRRLPSCLQVTFLIDVCIVLIAYLNLLYHLKLWRNSSVDCQTLICHPS